MKVIQINSECGRGSTGKIAVAVSRSLNEHKIENYIFYSANHKSDYPQGIMIGSKPMLRVHQLLSRLFGDQGFHSYFATRRLVREIKEISPDVILLHNIHGYYLHLSVLFRFLREYGKPVLWTLHDCWAFTGHCTHYMIAGCDRWKSGCGSCPQKNVYPYSLFFDRSRGLYKKKSRLFCSVKELSLITPSKWLSKELESSFLQNKPKYVIPNGIDLRAFHPVNGDFKERYGLQGRIMILGVASVWSYAKGLDVFIELYKRLDRDRYAVVLVGTDAQTERLLPEGIVSIRRTQSRTEMAEIYSAADVFVNPTRQDNYPTVNMEAQACGTPVITFDSGGCAETLTEGFGTTVNENDIEALILSVGELSEKTPQLSASCAAEAKRFDERICFEKYVDLCISRHTGTGDI